MLALETLHQYNMVDAIYELSNASINSALRLSSYLLATCQSKSFQQVQLLQEIGTPREEAPVTPGRPPAKGAPAAPPPGMVDLSGLTLGPCPLVPADQAAGAQVVQLHLHSAEPLPDTLQAAAAAAGTCHWKPAYTKCQHPDCFECCGRLNFACYFARNFNDFELHDMSC